MSCSDVWIEMAQSCPDVGKMEIFVLTQFATTYECEAAFSLLFDITMKSQNKLEATNDVRHAPAETKPNLEELIQARQMHISH